MYVINNQSSRDSSLMSLVRRCVSNDINSDSEEERRAFAALDDEVVNDMPVFLN